MLQRWAWTGEEFGSVVGYVESVFQANAELSADIYAGFVAKYHAGLQGRMWRPSIHIVLHEITPLVHIHSKSVTYPMSEVLEAGTVAGVRDIKWSVLGSTAAKPGIFLLAAEAEKTDVPFLAPVPLK